MTSDITISMMNGDFLLWRCLHGGPLSHNSIDRWESDSDMPWKRYQSRNLPLLAELTRVYGACAVVAWQGDVVVGYLRFYPKALWEMDGAGYLCLQQDYPAGPSDDFTMNKFLPRDMLADQTLKVHCMMTAPPERKGDVYRRKGIGTRMAKHLIGWATENDWKHIEVEAFEDIPLIYEITGSSGYIFWEKLGFRTTNRYPHPHLGEYDDFFKKLEKQAATAGIDTEKVRDCIVMSLDLDRS